MPLTPDQIVNLQQVGAERYGMPNVIDYGRGFVLTNFGGGTNMKAVSRDLKSSELQKT